MPWTLAQFRRLEKRIAARRGPAGAPPGSPRSTTMASAQRDYATAPGGSPPDPPSPASWGPREWWVEMAPETNNRLLRMHWAERKRNLQKWAIAILAQDLRGPWAQFRAEAGPWKVYLRVTVLRKKLQDPDNRVASVKPVLDALRKLGWLYDDSDEWLRLEVEELVRKVKRTVISWRLAP